MSKSVADGVGGRWVLKMGQKLTASHPLVP